MDDRMKRFEVFWNDLKNALEHIKSNSNDGVFNQYLEPNNTLDVPGDLPDAHSIRTENLRTYLKSIRPAPVLIVGEAPSHRGTRFSGVPLFGEKQVIDILHGRQSSNAGDPLCSKTDTIFWKVMLEYYHRRRFLCWNAFPLHPHKRGEAMTNRTPKNEEVRQFKSVLELIKNYFEPSHIIAVGRKAEKQLKAIDENLQYEYVRHPSKGGTREFATKMRRLFETL